MLKSRIPSLNWLRVFEAAARTGSFAKAADLLSMSAPGVSQQIKALEDYLGKPLFIRAAHSVSLTPAGEAFFPAVQQALLYVETAAAGLFGSKLEEPLYVRATLLFAVGWLSPRLPKFAQEHPAIRVRLTTSTYPEDFIRGSFDLQILFGDAPPPEMQGDRLMGERLYPVALPEVAGQISSAEDLARYRLVEVATHRVGWIQVLSEAGVRNPDGFSFDFTDSTVMSFALAASGGVIALARAPASDWLQGVHGLEPCLGKLAVSGTQYYWVSYPAREGLRPAARKFRDWLLKEISA